MSLISRCVALSLTIHVLEAKFLEEKAPDAVQPADDDTGGDGYYDADDKSDEALLFKPCAPPYDNLDHPVYAGDEKEDYLHKAGQSVEPGHTQLLYIIFAGSAARAVTLQIYYITHFPDVKTRRRENFGAEKRRKLSATRNSARHIPRPQKNSVHIARNFQNQI